MNTIWHDYKTDKPTRSGYIVVAERYGDVDTLKYDAEMGGFSKPIDEMECIIQWAYLDDILPECCKKGFMWSDRALSDKEAQYEH